MLTGAHSIIYSTNPEADRAFLRDVFKLPFTDAGDGWLIFGLPPAEVAIHPSEQNDIQELYLICDDIKEFVARMNKEKIPCSKVENQSWGLLTHLTMPGGGKLGVYEPRHPRPKQRKQQPARKKPLKKKTK
jgi:hypothetical protein